MSLHLLPDLDWWSVGWAPLGTPACNNSERAARALSCHLALPSRSSGVVDLLGMTQFCKCLIDWNQTRPCAPGEQTPC